MSFTTSLILALSTFGSDISRYIAELKKPKGASKQQQHTNRQQCQGGM